MEKAKDMLRNFKKDIASLGPTSRKECTGLLETQNRPHNTRTNILASCWSFLKSYELRYREERGSA